MVNPLFRINDLDERGGGFIREKKIRKTISGEEVYTGTVIYGNGKKAAVLALIYPRGNGRILRGIPGGNKDNFLEFEEYVERLKGDHKYRRLLMFRMFLSINVKIALFITAAGLIINLADINPFNSFWNMAYIITEVIGTVLIAKINSHIKEI